MTTPKCARCDDTFWVPRHRGTLYDPGSAWGARMDEVLGFFVGVLVRMLDSSTLVIATGLGLGVSRQIDIVLRWLLVAVGAVGMATGVLMLVGGPPTTMYAVSQVTANFLQIAIASELFRRNWPPKIN
jgi:uncharacterized membrane protein YedE/YeeE